MTSACENYGRMTVFFQIRNEIQITKKSKKKEKTDISD